MEADHRSILNNYQSTYHPRFGFTPKIGSIPADEGFVFTVSTHAKLVSIKMDLFRVKLLP